MSGESLAIAAKQLPTWEPPHEDVPTRGRPMSARVQAVGAPYRELLEKLMRLPPDVMLSAAEPLCAGSPERATRLLAGIVAVQTAIDGRPASAAGALRWFVGGRLSRTCERPMEQVGWSADGGGQLSALLPYALDPFGQTTRRALIAGDACRHERASRKRLGAFYTPGDVARMLAKEVITPDTRRVLDPACGAGVFLRAAFTQLMRTLAPRRAVECLHGVDVDAAAIDACALVLTHDWLMRDPVSGGEAPLDRFEEVCSRLIHGDALTLFAQPVRASPNGERKKLAHTLPRSFDAILTNPPFAPVGPCAEDVSDGFESLRAAGNPAGLNMMWPFWELASNAVSDGGRVGIVLPLSSAYLRGSAPRAARSAVFKRGKWEMRFFDRAPDALFGDDVKQRVALAIRRPGPAGLLRTTAMRRWSSDRRAAVLGAGGDDGIDLPARAELVVKIGSEGERRAIERLHSLGATLADAASDIRMSSAAGLTRGEQAIAIAPTAYNWVGAYRDTLVASRARRAVAGKLLELVFADRTLADAAYATLASHVFLWWWRATGDLFHISRSTLTRAPFPLQLCDGPRLEGLAAAGRDCWRAARSAPVRSVNRGIVTVAYAPAADHETLEAVDDEVGRAFGLDQEFVRFVRNDAGRLRGAGRGA